MKHYPIFIKIFLFLIYISPLPLICYTVVITNKTDGVIVVKLHLAASPDVMVFLKPAETRKLSTLNSCPTTIGLRGLNGTITDKTAVYIPPQTTSRVSCRDLKLILERSPDNEITPTNTDSN